MNQRPATHPDSGGCLPEPSRNFCPQAKASATSKCTSCATRKRVRITVQSTTWRMTKPATSHGLHFSSPAQATRRAAPRRPIERMRERAAAAKETASVIAMARRFRHILTIRFFKKRFNSVAVRLIGQCCPIDDLPVNVELGSAVIYAHGCDQPDQRPP